MRKGGRTIILLSIFIIIVPFSGLPQDMRAVLLTLIALSIITVVYTAKDKKDEEIKSKNIDNAESAGDGVKNEI